MKNSEKILLELQKMNQEIKYFRNPYKHAFRQFGAGMFHALGSLFGTFILAALFIYFMRQVDLVKPITRWIEDVMSQINWNQIIPTPQLAPGNLDLKP